MLRFNQEVRRSIAAQLIRVSWAGSGFFGLTSLIGGGGVALLVAIVIWWFAFQIFGHLLLAYEDEDHGDSGSG